VAYLLFVDESGQDHREAPYEVLAGLAVQDRDLWNLVVAVQESEERHFGRRYREPGKRELKAMKLLKKKVFRLARQLPPFPDEERRRLSHEALDDGAHATQHQMTALAQAKIAFVKDILALCVRFRCRIFASIVDPASPVPGREILRKDYSYLFERFYYFLEDQRVEAGLVVFDELEKSQSHVLVGQMDYYFKFTQPGKQRANLVLPEPFFVHSDLTTGIQLADLAAYVISWSVRFGTMSGPKRAELEDIGQVVLGLKYRATREIDGNPNFSVSSLVHIKDLRPAGERLSQAEQA
jgi:hypothetical protein